MKRTSWQRNKLSIAVTAALANASGAYAAGEIEEIVVTATKRAAGLQDVAVAVQAMTGDGLREQGIETFDKYVDYLPNVVGAGNGPGKKELYIRGSATEQTSVTISSAQGSAPGVALYLDEQPVSFGGRNLDVYGADLERIEVLAGPQGTLFGASSQSGNLRLITNKPAQGEFEAGFKATYSRTRGGADSSGVDGYVNVPVTDALAIRAVVYSDTQGGWIDNVPATFTPSGAVVDRNNVAGYGPLLTGADSVTVARNDALVQDDWNEASYRGMRLGVAYDINLDWEVLVQHTAQTLEAEGAFIVDPSLGDDYAIGNFSPDYNRDEFGLTTWTLSGRLWGLDVIYTGGHLSRQVDSVIDYTHYNNGGGYITYYLCSGNIYDSTGLDPNNCYDPTKQYTEDTENTRTTHEFRFTTDPSNRWHVLAGVYMNDAEANHIGDFQYASSNPAFAEHISNYNNDNSGDGFLLGNASLPTAGVNASGPRPPYTTFFNDFTREVEELAFFGEFSFDLTEDLSVALSARRYDLTSTLTGASNFSFGCRYGIGSNAQETADGRCNGTDFSNDVTARLRTLGRYGSSGDDSIILNARSPNGEDGSPRDMFRGGGSNQATLDAIKNGYLDIGSLESDGSINEVDTIVRGTLSWQATNDLMLFVGFAEGYRPAALNRNAGQLSTEQEGVFENYVVPAAALTDHLESYEVGLKGDFLGFRVNATLYRSDIEDMQVSRFDPSNVAFLYFIENVGDAEVTGFDADFIWAPTDRLTITGAFTVLDTELTRINRQLNGIAVPVGSELPLAPGFAGNIRLNYQFPLDALQADGFINAGLNYRGESVSGIIGNAEFMDDTLFRQAGRVSGLKRQDEGGTYGTVEIPVAGPGVGDPSDVSGDLRLPKNSRFVNPDAIMLNLSFGIVKDGWRGELFADNVNNEDAPTMQIAGHYTPYVTRPRPRTIGLRLTYDFQ